MEATHPLSPCGKARTGEELFPRMETLIRRAWRATLSHKGRREEQQSHLPSIAAVIQRVMSLEAR